MSVVQQPQRLNAAVGKLPELVLLHGWGSDSTVFAALAADLARDHRVRCIDFPGVGNHGDEVFPTEESLLLEWLRKRIPQGAVLIGWSLGGAIALRFAQRYPEQLGAVVTIATNPRFVQAPDWPHAMDAAQFASFRESIQQAGSAGLGRFYALQTRGDRNAAQVLRGLRNTRPRGANPEALIAMLDLLASLDLREGLARLRLPTLHVLGERDVLVPCAVSADYRCLQPHASVWVLDGAAHAAFLSHPLAMLARLREFVQGLDRGIAQPAPQRSKHAVARSFGRAAGGYEAAARLQRDTGTQLLALLPDTAPQRVLDLGSGTGYFAAALAQRYTSAQVIGLDIAEPMLHVARDSHAQAATWLAADAEALPLAADSIELLYSNLALQWCEQLPRALAEIARVLCRGGRAALCTLGSDTLWELRAAWRAVDGRVHVNRFLDLHRVEAMVQDAGLRIRLMRQQDHVLHYRDVAQLARELRQLGAHNLNRGRPEGLSGRAAWQQLQRAYEEFTQPGGLPATYQAMYLLVENARD